MSKVSPKVKYLGYFNASSGMGTAARNIVQAMNAAGISVLVEAVANINSEKYLGENHELLAKLTEKIDYDFKIVHVTPDLMQQHLEPMKKHIFHFFWETDKLPKWFVWSLNLCDEVWTGCEWNRATFKNSGVKSDIWVCPQPIETPEKIEPFEIRDRPEFMFYSVFQWIERKNPRTLLEAFWKEFDGNRNVGLMIKTYKEKFSPKETQQIVNDIFKWKAELGVGSFPKIYLYTQEMSKPDVFRFHKTGDCFVSAHRGEGFGVPQAEAMSIGKPVISTDLGGIHEAVPKDYFYGVKYSWESVHDMDWVPWYESDQKWANVDIEDLRSKMRFVYENREEARQTAAKAKDFVDRNLSMKVIGEKMRRRLMELSK